MGGISSCCSAEPAENKEVIKGNGDPTMSKDGSMKPRGFADDGNPEELLSQPPKPPAATAATLSDAAIAEFQRRLESSMDVIVLLADGTRLTCDLKLNSDTKSLIISCDANLREIPLSELKAILHGKDQLRRVETKASLTEDPNCVALHMLTGNCIPIRFETVEEKIAFIEVIKKLKSI